jgi:hypothetical protein
LIHLFIFFLDVEYFIGFIVILLFGLLIATLAWFVEIIVAACYRRRKPLVPNSSLSSTSLVTDDNFKLAVASNQKQSTIDNYH